MSYVVIARRWRPQQFDEIIGQEHVSKTLSNAIANNRIAHSYIFTGPRGIGKTTTARIFAKALNCEKGPTPTPCNECPSCTAITKGNSLDVLEIDGASNRGIDEIRNLRENIRYTPSLGKYRIYIIDEVHMLTKEAFNALLKTLEEPPSHALFIFATTEIHRVPATILSRCQRYDFKRMPLKIIMEHLKHICKEEKIEIEEDAMLQIAKKADGSMRDSQSILDQIISYSGDKITFDHVAQALGVISQDIFFQVTEHVKSGGLKELIILSKEILASGYDLNEFLLGLEEHFRNILITRTMDSTELIDVSENYLERYKQIAQSFNENDLIIYLQILSDTANAVKMSRQPHLKFELGLIKLVKMPSSLQIENILEKLELLKKKAQPSIVAENTQEVYSSAPPVSNTTQPVLTVEQVKNNWEKIIEALNAKKPSLSAILEQVEIVKLEKEILSLLLKKCNSFQQNIVDSQKKIIEEVISDVVKSKIKIEIKYEPVSSEETNQNGAQKSKNDKSKIMEKIRSEDQLTAKIIDELDLQLI